VTLLEGVKFTLEDATLCNLNANELSERNRAAIDDQQAAIFQKCAHLPSTIDSIGYVLHDYYIYTTPQGFLGYFTMQSVSPLK
jgi:hypothetical protein